jgi:hypothetical protein
MYKPVIMRIASCVQNHAERLDKFRSQKWDEITRFLNDGFNGKQKRLEADVTRAVTAVPWWNDTEKQPSYPWPDTRTRWINRKRDLALKYTAMSESVFKEESEAEWRRAVLGEFCSDEIVLERFLKCNVINRSYLWNCYAWNVIRLVATNILLDEGGLPPVMVDIVVSYLSFDSCRDCYRSSNCSGCMGSVFRAICKPQHPINRIVACIQYHNDRRWDTSASPLRIEGDADQGLEHMSDCGEPE